MVAQNAQERLLHLADVLEGSRRVFQQKIGKSCSYIVNVTTPSRKALRDIKAAYPQVNTDWIITGEGEIRGSQLVSCGKVIAEYKPTRGGYKVGSGRPRGNRNVTMTVKISPEAHDKLSTLTDNKSEYIDSLILRQ